MTAPDLFLEIAKYLPSEFRKEIIQRVYEINDSSINRTAKQINITRAQLYRYLGLSKRRNYPSDLVVARALKALYRQHPKEAIYLLRQQAHRLLSLIEHLERPHPSISTGTLS